MNDKDMNEINSKNGASYIFDTLAYYPLIWNFFTPLVIYQKHKNNEAHENNIRAVKKQQMRIY